MDLPEPAPVSLSKEERQKRNWHLLLTCLLFSAIYATLHKLLIPLFLKATQLTESAYSHIDLWFLHPVLLYLVLRRKSSLDTLSSFLSGLGISYAIYEVYLVGVGQTVGWLAFSKLLAALPVAFCCVALLSTPSFGRKISFAWLGVACFTLVFFGVRSFAPETTPDVTQEEIVETPAVAEVTQPEACGQAKIHFPKGGEIAPGPLTIKACGFQPAVLEGSSTLVIRNEQKTALNVHLVFFRNGRQSGSWNEMIPAESSREKNLDWQSNDVALVFSDSNPRTGVVLLVPSGNSLAWQATRSPLKVRSVE